MKFNTRNKTWMITAARIRTVGFVLAMIPMAAAVATLGLLSLLALSPLIVYARFQGKHLKDPWGKAQLLP